MSENEVKITRPIHGEVGPFSIDVNPDGSVSIHVQPDGDAHGSDLIFSAAEFALFGALVTRVRKAQGSSSSKGPKTTTRKRRTQKAAAAAADAPQHALPNGAAESAAS